MAWFAAGKREALERLCKYILRPAAATDRFEDTGDGRIAVRLKRRWSDGTTHIVLTPAELVERLVALIPRPRQNQIRYFGVFAPRHHLRQRIVTAQAQRAADDDNADAEDEDDCCKGSRMAWARLMKRVFGFEVLVCPRCKSSMQRIAFVTAAQKIEEVLASAGYAADSPPRAAA